MRGVVSPTETQLDNRKEGLRTENASQTFEEPEIAEEEENFIVYFLYEDEDQNVRVEEVGEVDFLEVIQHLNFGGSVFITRRRKPQRLDPKKQV